MRDPRKPYTPDTLAERWGCSAETVRQMLRDGRFQGFRVGRMFRIPAASVDAYEAGHESDRPEGQA